MPKRSNHRPKKSNKNKIYTAMMLSLGLSLGTAIPCFAREIDGTTVPDYHNWQQNWTVQTPPTCVSEGIEILYCDGCDLTQTRSIAATGHNLITTIVQEATCIEEGLRVTTCKNPGCDYKSEEVIPELGHELAIRETQATTEQDGKKETYCTRCGEVVHTEILPKIVKETPEKKKVVKKTPKKTSTTTTQTKKTTIASVPVQESVDEQPATEESIVEEPVVEQVPVAAGGSVVAKKASKTKKQTTKKVGWNSMVQEYAVDGCLMTMGTAMMSYGILILIPFYDLCKWEKKRRQQVLEKIKKEVLA